MELEKSPTRKLFLRWFSGSMFNFRGVQWLLLVKLNIELLVQRNGSSSDHHLFLERICTVFRFWDVAKYRIPRTHPFKHPPSKNGPALSIGSTQTLFWLSKAKPRKINTEPKNHHIEKEKSSSRPPSLGFQPLVFPGLSPWEPHFQYYWLIEKLPADHWWRSWDWLRAEKQMLSVHVIPSLKLTAILFLKMDGWFRWISLK